MHSQPVKVEVPTKFGTPFSWNGRTFVVSATGQVIKTDDGFLVHVAELEQEEEMGNVNPLWLAELGMECAAKIGLSLDSPMSWHHIEIHLDAHPPFVVFCLC